MVDGIFRASDTIPMGTQYCLNVALMLHKNQLKDTFVAFVDFTKCFDLIDRYILFYRYKERCLNITNRIASHMIFYLCLALCLKIGYLQTCSFSFRLLILLPMPTGIIYNDPVVVSLLAVLIFYVFRFLLPQVKILDQHVLVTALHRTTSLPGNSHD